ncbi:MAG: chemotaxis protein CheW [Spirochaetota bacterium]
MSAHDPAGTGSSGDSDSGSVMLVVFAAGNSFMAYDARSVGEVIRLPRITRSYGAAPYVMGVVNLRGRIITVIDLEAKLGLPRTEPHDPRLLVIEEAGGEAIGVQVPALHDVIEADVTEIQPMRADLRGADPELFVGVLRRDDMLVAILDPKRSLSVA